jgi:hypothetical protein
MPNHRLSVKESSEILNCDDATTGIKPDLKALSFFSGCMDLDLGLEKEGIKVLLACSKLSKLLK